MHEKERANKKGSVGTQRCWRVGKQFDEDVSYCKSLYITVEMRRPYGKYECEVP